MKRSYTAVLISAIRTAQIILENPYKFNAITLAKKQHITVKVLRFQLKLIRLAYGIYPDYDRKLHTFGYRAPSPEAITLINAWRK